MTDYQQLLYDIKSDVLNFLINTSGEVMPFNKVFDSFKSLLTKYFDITESTFLLYEANTNTLFSLQDSDSHEMKTEAIPWAIVKPFFYQQCLARVPLFLKEKVAFQDMTDMVICKAKQEEPVGVLLLKRTEKWKNFTKTKYIKDLINNVVRVLHTINDNQKVISNEKRYRKLYSMTELFHSTMDIDLILENVLLTIQENFSDLDVELILSNDQDRQTKLEIKLFDYMFERPSTIEAFVSGEITVELAEDLNSRILNAPIKGRQAIYGILQVRAPIRYVFTNVQKGFIQKLANASGNALENAKLYHQSHRLIRDLQLINETSHRLNSKIDIGEMLEFLQQQLIKSFQPMEVGFVLEINDSFKVLRESSDIFKTEEGNKYVQHAEKHFKISTDSVFIADFSRVIPNELEYHSLMAIPMVVEEKIIGFCIVLHKNPYFFSFDSFKLMQSLIHHSSLAIANSVLRDQLQEMVDRDHLTKLYARSYLDRYVENSLKQDDEGMFLLIDIDNFKLVNDTYGHQIGDQVLVQIAEQLKKSIGSLGICARWGGEELAIYIPNIKYDEAIKISEKIVASVPQVTSPKVSISAGLVPWDKVDRPAFQSIFIQADTALYKAKKNGKNQVCIYDETLQHN